MIEDHVRPSVFLNPDQLQKYIGEAEPVTDDNQLLSFGGDIRHWRSDKYPSVVIENGILLDLARQ